MPDKAMAGPASTIPGKVDASADPHETLLAWTGLLSKAPAGSIWVSQPNDRVVAHMGELSAETLKNKGIRGCVADGFVRDVNFLLALGFGRPGAADSRRATSLATAAAASSRRHQDPVMYVIAPGDDMVGDRDGPTSRAGLACRGRDRGVRTGDRHREPDLQAAILEGMDPQQAYLRYGKF